MVIEPGQKEAQERPYLYNHWKGGCSQVGVGLFQVKSNRAREQAASAVVHIGHQEEFLHGERGLTLGKKKTAQEGDRVTVLGSV